MACWHCNQCRLLSYCTISSLLIKTPVFEGIVWSFLIISVLLLTICIGVVWRTPHDIERVSQFATYEQEKLNSEEPPRIETALRNSDIIETVEMGLLLVGHCPVLGSL